MLFLPFLSSVFLLVVLNFEVRKTSRGFLYSVADLVMVQMPL